jgi:hypothetical protein
MKLLTQMPSLWVRLWRSPAWFTFCVAGLLLCVEAFGRGTPSDWYDAGLALVVASLAFVVHLHHRQQALAWVTWPRRQVQRIGQWLSEQTFSISIDLRGSPPIKRGYPPLVVGLLIVLAAWCASAGLAAAGLPDNLRLIGTHGIYVVYLVGLVALWTVLLGACLFAVFVPLAMIHDAFVARFDGTGYRHRRPEMWALGLYLVGLALVGLLVPLWLQVTVCGLALFVNLISMAIPANTDVQFIWRPKDSVQVRSIPWGWWSACEFGLLTLLLCALVFTTAGVQVMGGSAAKSNMPVTMLLGNLLGTLAPGMLVAWVVHAVISRYRDPARPARPVLHVRNDVSAQERKQIRYAAARCGWAVRWSTQPLDRTNVGITLVPADQSCATDFDPPWPLPVSLADLDNPNVFDRLYRRHEITQRRLIVTGLERLFKRALRKDYRFGNGFLVAPHFWFVGGLSRDDQEEELDLNDSPLLSNTIGTPYHRSIARPARHHLYRMFRALQVDMLFVEDGVSYRKLVRVLRRLFEVYDKNAGQKRLEDFHLNGLHKLRVIIHEFQLDEPYKMDGYPEPKYEQLGRARILHVFRDRGEQEELTETPFDFTQTPAPMSAL